MEYIEQETERQCKNPKKPKVPNSTFWLVGNEEIIAVANLRHRLNENLQKRGGHIGYFVKPSEWGKGYGTKILQLALKEAQNLGISKALITCDDSNIGSFRVIEKNNGILEKTEEYNGELIRYYWIESQNS